jgi:hypothetical protein
MDATVYRDTSLGGAPSTSGGVVGLGYGFLENFSEKTDAAFKKAKASAPKWCAKNYAGGGGAGVEVVATLKGHYNTDILDLRTGEVFWKAARRKPRNPVAATVPIDLETESHLVWGDLIRAITREDWKKANAAKKRVETAQRSLMKEIKEGRKRWVPRLFAREQKTDLGVVREMYTLRPNVREDPPECDRDWHEHIGKAVFEDL